MLPVGRQVLWSILFCIIVVVATLGNFVVIWIVAVNRRMRTVTNYLLVNLSLADAMISTLNVTINFVYMLNSHWPFGYFYCKFNQFIAVVSISASVFTLMVISIDRYMAIVNPLRPRLGKRATLAIMTAIWVGSAVIGIPNLVYFTTDFDYLPDGSVREVCYSEWPDGLTTRSEIEYIYNVIFMMVTYFIPIIAMTYTYARIGVELWGSKSIGESSQRQADNVKGKRRHDITTWRDFKIIDDCCKNTLESSEYKGQEVADLCVRLMFKIFGGSGVVKMMIVIVVIFAVCWLPFHVYFIITSNYPEVTNYPPIQEIYLAIYWLAMSTVSVSIQSFNNTPMENDNTTKV
ncbi:Tachykinin-like peptides receptor 99D [Papilio machaon]|uniref:Tachykinin-like peptides receptor 99D n=1 Tax=Papilio machaon TaxID=76193 RepID=A0A0N0PEL7_PAPMA|nr:Tachykinin-like peptides receptor 99D [Papilio machaon]